MAFIPFKGTWLITLPNHSWFKHMLIILLNNKLTVHHVSLD